MYKKKDLIFSYLTRNEAEILSEKLTEIKTKTAQKISKTASDNLKTLADSLVNVFSAQTTSLSDNKWLKRINTLIDLILDFFSGDFSNNERKKRELSFATLELLGLIDIRDQPVVNKIINAWKNFQKIDLPIRARQKDIDTIYKLLHNLQYKESLKNILKYMNVKNIENRSRQALIFTFARQMTEDGFRPSDFNPTNTRSNDRAITPTPSPLPSPTPTPLFCFV